jgi:hypothetical protein
LELDPNTIDSAQREVEREVPTTKEEVIIKEPLLLTKDKTKEALCEALISYISSYINLIFS